MAIHASAIIDSQALIDSTATIGPYCVIGESVRIGARSTLGRSCRSSAIQTSAAIARFTREPSWETCRRIGLFSGGVSYCRIGDGTILREHVTVHRGTAPESATVVGQRCFVMAGAHIGHNCHVHDEAISSTARCWAVCRGRTQRDGLWKCRGPSIRANRELAMIGGLTMVTQDVPPYFMLDNRGLCVGINRIGLRRAGLSREECEEAKAAYRVLVVCREA